MLSIESTEKLVEVIAVIRPGAVTRTVRALEQIEQLAFTRWRALGRGRQRGICFGGDASTSTSIEWLSKAVLSVVIPAERRQSVTDAIVKANRTESVGDGRIFVCPMDEDVSVRTGGRCAVMAEV